MTDVEITIRLTTDEVRTMINCILGGEMGFAEMNLFQKLSTQLVRKVKVCTCNSYILEKYGCKCGNSDE